jgi:hypothetical protein
MQAPLGRSRWRADDLRDRVRAYVPNTLGDPDSVRRLHRLCHFRLAYSGFEHPSACNSTRHYRAEPLAGSAHVVLGGESFVALACYRRCETDPVADRILTRSLGLGSSWSLSVVAT